MTSIRTETYYYTSISIIRIRRAYIHGLVSFDFDLEVNFLFRNIRRLPLIATRAGADVPFVLRKIHNEWKNLEKDLIKDQIEDLDALIEDLCRS